MVPAKQCRICKLSFVASLKHFYSHAFNVDRLEGRCKGCAKLANRARRIKKHGGSPLNPTPRRHAQDRKPVRVPVKICKQCFGLPRAVRGPQCAGCGLSAEVELSR